MRELCGGQGSSEASKPVGDFSSCFGDPGSLKASVTSK